MISMTFAMESGILCNIPATTTLPTISSINAITPNIALPIKSSTLNYNITKQPRVNLTAL